MSEIFTHALSKEHNKRRVTREKRRERKLLSSAEPSIDKRKNERSRIFVEQKKKKVQDKKLDQLGVLL